MMDRHFKRDNAPDIRLAVEENGERIFIGVGGLMVDVHSGEDGVTVQITKGNDVLGEAVADYAEGAE